MAGAVLGASHVIFNLIPIAQWGRHCYYAHFTDDETGAQRG